MYRSKTLVKRNQNSASNVRDKKYIKQERGQGESRRIRVFRGREGRERYERVESKL